MKEQAESAGLRQGTSNVSLPRTARFFSTTFDADSAASERQANRDGLIALAVIFLSMVLVGWLTVMGWMP